MLSLFKRAGRSSSQIGVFVTAEGVAAAQLSSAGAKPRIERCVYERRTDNEPITRALQRLPNRRAPTVSVLDPGGYRLLLVEAPDVPPDELRAAVRWRVKDLIDFHVDDAVIDVFEMPPHARGGRNRMMYAVTARADYVKQQIGLIEGAGLNLDVVDIGELSLRNVAMLFEAEQRGTAFLYLGARKSTLLLVRQGVLYLARHVETGVATLAEAGERRLEVVGSLALEVRRSLDYFESHYEQTSIPQLYTCGLDAEDREHLAHDVGIAVRDADLKNIIDMDEALSPELQRLCLPAIGAALRKDAVTL